MQLFLEENNYINKSQHGFLKGRSTTTALITYSEFLSNSLDRNYCIDSAYFDLSKAFDSVRHDYLIQKLTKAGISGNLLKWIINYLQDRTQVVNVHGIISSERKISSGVIQGSVLGPIFFTIFINDIDQSIKNSTIVKYADDMKIYRCFKSDMKNQIQNSALFQEDINGLTTWSEDWDLKFNIAKCCVMHFGHKNIKSIYKIHDSQLKYRDQEKDLGVLFSSKFKFDDHINLIVKKANRQLAIIARVFRNRSVKTIIPLYKTFVRPILEYNSVIWSPYTKANEKKIENIQKKMCKLIYRQESLTYKEKLKNLKMLTLKTRRIQQQLALMYKMRKGCLNLSFDDFFCKNNYKKTRGNVHKLLIPKSKTKSRREFFTISAIKYWNQLKSMDINARSYNLFKKKILNYFDRTKIW